MKKINVVFAMFMVMFASTFVSAQKMATMDVASILAAMPEKKKIDDQLKTFADSKQAEIKKQADAAQALYEKYSKEAASQSAETNKSREAEVQKLAQNLENLRSAAVAEIKKREDAAYAPIEQKFQAAVEKVAKSNGYDFILDSNSTVFIYKNGPDATAQVKKELGL